MAGLQRRDLKPLFLADVFEVGLSGGCGLVYARVAVDLDGSVTLDAPKGVKDAFSRSIPELVRQELCYPVHASSGFRRLPD